MKAADEGIEGVVRIITDDGDAQYRLDLFLSEAYPDRSRSFFQKLIKSGDVTVNGKQEKPSYLLGADEEIEIHFPEPEKLEILPEDIPLEIVYEDEDVILVNKPKGMVVHPAPGHFSGTLVNALLYHCSDLSGINGMLRPGIVHRIDRDTTGIVIACKNDAAHLKLSSQLSATVRSSRAILRRMKERLRARSAATGKTARKWRSIP